MVCQRCHIINKSAATNLLSVALAVAGFYLPPPYGPLMLSAGLFALSGALTNWLAVHMLFEKVPLLYGSGVIPARFEAFKAAIHSLMMEQFFSETHMQRLLMQAMGGEEDSEEDRKSRARALMSRIDFDRLYDGLVEAIMESSFSTMLSMVGGRKALEPMKEKIVSRLQKLFVEMVDINAIAEGLIEGHTEELRGKIDTVIRARLDELTPQMVKTIVQDLIAEHLGWLVVWGGVFGGLIGLAYGIIPLFA